MDELFFVEEPLRLGFGRDKGLGHIIGVERDDKLL